FTYAQGLFGLFLLGDITSNRGSAHNHAASAFHRRNGYRSVDGMAVLVDASSLKSRDMLAAPQARHDLGKLIWVIWMYQIRYGLPQSLLRFVPVYLFGTFVPTYNGAVYSLPNDGIVRSVHESAQVNKCVLGRYMLRDITGDYGGAYNHAASVYHRRN